MEKKDQYPITPPSPEIKYFSDHICIACKVVIIFNIFIGLFVINMRLYVLPTYYIISCTTSEFNKVNEETMGYNGRAILLTIRINSNTNKDKKIIISIHLLEVCGACGIWRGGDRGVQFQHQVVWCVAHQWNYVSCN